MWHVATSRPPGGETHATHVHLHTSREEKIKATNLLGPLECGM